MTDEPRHGWSDQQVEQLLGNLLRYGVILAAGVVLLGGVLYLVQNAAARPDYEKFRGQPPEFRTLSGIIADALRGDGQGVIQLGLLLLIAIPVARVALSVVAFALQRDRVYVVVTLLVLCVLLISLFGGRL
jgi:uncharacterized membrane protein